MESVIKDGIGQRVNDLSASIEDVLLRLNRIDAWSVNISKRVDDIASDYTDSTAFRSIIGRLNKLEEAQATVAAGQAERVRVERQQDGRLYVLLVYIGNGWRRFRTTPDSRAALAWLLDKEDTYSRAMKFYMNNPQFLVTEGEMPDAQLAVNETLLVFLEKVTSIAARLGNAELDEALREYEGRRTDGND